MDRNVPEQFGLEIEILPIPRHGLAGHAIGGKVREEATVESTKREAVVANECNSKILHRTTIDHTIDHRPTPQNQTKSLKEIKVSNSEAILEI
jgi:hypothetical protein